MTVLEFLLFLLLTKKIVDGLDSLGVASQSLESQNKTHSISTSKLVAEKLGGFASKSLLHFSACLISLAVVKLGMALALHFGIQPA